METLKYPQSLQEKALNEKYILIVGVAACDAYSLPEQERSDS